jgi:hypothetical protein
VDGRRACRPICIMTSGAPRRRAQSRRGGGGRDVRGRTPRRGGVRHSLLLRVVRADPVPVTAIPNGNAVCGWVDGWMDRSCMGRAPRASELDGVESAPPCAVSWWWGFRPGGGSARCLVPAPQCRDCPSCTRPESPWRAAKTVPSAPVSRFNSPGDPASIAARHARLVAYMPTHDQVLFRWRIWRTPCAQHTGQIDPPSLLHWRDVTRHKARRLDRAVCAVVLCLPAFGGLPLFVCVLPSRIQHPSL